MAKNKVDMNKNFENLKAQMLKKRELAETVKKEITKDNILESTQVDSDNNVILDRNNNTNITNNENVTYDTNENINNDVNIKTNSNNVEAVNSMDSELSSEESKDNDLTYNSSEYIARKTGTVSDININKIVIKKIEKQEQPKRITYYLRPETIKKIDRFSKLSGMGKSEFVQKILDEVLNNLEIER